jgi:Spy/CpxP family protein refolding chaperone
MLRIRLAVTCSLALFLSASWLMGQDNKSTSDDAKPATGKTKGVLPKYFSKLGLTDEQRQKVYKITTSYKTKIDALTEQLDQLKSQRQAELLKVLDENQRTHLRELETHETVSKDSTTKKEEKK